MTFFNYDFSIKDVVLPKGIDVIEIQDRAFKGCDSLTSFLVPASVSTIGINPIAECAGLKSVKIAPGNNRYVSIRNCIVDRGIALNRNSSCKPLATLVSGFSGSHHPREHYHPWLGP